MTAAAVSTRGRVLVDLLVTSRLAQVSCVAAFVLAIAVSAQLAVPLPFSPVPITLQTFVVLLGAAALGPLRSAAGVASYLAIGAFGVPWFAVTGGATLGYLAGFFVAALLVGRWARAGGDRSVPKAALLMAVGNLVIYACGVVGPRPSPMDWSRRSPWESCPSRGRRREDRCRRGSPPGHLAPRGQGRGPAVTPSLPAPASATNSQCLAQQIVP